MCYASPGPRCEGHASERYEKVNEKSRQVVSDLLKTEKAIEKFEKESPDAIGTPKHKAMVKKKNKLQDDAVKFSKKTKEAREDMDATKGGMDKLRARIAAVNAGNGTAEDTADLVTLHQRLKSGYLTFKDKMEAYDTENETVDGRSPSPYGDDKGVIMIGRKMDKIKEKYDKADSYSERTELYMKYDSLNKSRMHAVKTREHAKKGIINPYKASLKSNQEDYRKSKLDHKKAQDNLDKVAAEREEFREKIRNVEGFERTHNRTSPSRYSAESKRKIAQYQDEMMEHSKKFHRPALEAEAEARRKMNSCNVAVSKSYMSKFELARNDEYIATAGNTYGSSNAYGESRYNGD